MQECIEKHNNLSEKNIGITTCSLSNAYCYCI